MLIEKGTFMVLTDFSTDNDHFHKRPQFKEINFSHQPNLIISAQSVSSAIAFAIWLALPVRSSPPLGYREWWQWGQNQWSLYNLILMTSYSFFVCQVTQMFSRSWEMRAYKEVLEEGLISSEVFPELWYIIALIIDISLSLSLSFLLILRHSRNLSKMIQQHFST